MEDVLKPVTMLKDRLLVLAVKVILSDLMEKVVSVRKNQTLIQSNILFCV